MLRAPGRLQAYLPCDYHVHLLYCTNHSSGDLTSQDSQEQVNNRRYLESMSGNAQKCGQNVDD